MLEVLIFTEVGSALMTFLGGKSALNNVVEEVGMPFIANIALDRGPKVPMAHRHKRIGSLFHDPSNGENSLKLTGIGIGQFVAKPYSDAEVPKHPIQGDLMVATGEYEKESMLVKEYQWIGVIMTSQEHDNGTIYWGWLSVVPIVNGKNNWVYAHVMEGK